MLVLDASAVVELVLRGPAADAVEREIAAARFELHVPHLLDLEVLSAVRRRVARAEVSESRGAEAIEDLLDLPVQRHAHTLLAWRIWELRENLSAYDASYVALAEVLAGDGARLLTADARLARAARDHSTVRVLLAA
jgi:predicted nucleic acid-binding protein